MITAYSTRPDGRLRGRRAEDVADLDPDVQWVDLVAPDARERRWVLEAYRQQLPSEGSVEEIEASSRFFQDEDGVHVRSFFLQEKQDPPTNFSVGFILGESRLYTIRQQELPTFESFAKRASSKGGLAPDPLFILLRLFETKVDRLADVLEALHEELEALSLQVFSPAERSLEELMTRLARAQDINDKTRLSLRDKQRALSFLLKTVEAGDEANRLLREILGDIDSLTGHSTFLFDKMSLLMDATIGLINIEQNKIIKIFSIAAVIFLPPTLVASIYGMNFEHIPELSWQFGYPLSLVLMTAAAGSVYWYFRQKGWL